MNLRLKYLPKMKILNFLLTFIYPKTCMSCNTLLNYNTKIELCDNCAKDFNPYRGNRCITCDRPIDNTGECSICKSEKIYFEKGYCVYPYAGAVRNTILNFKFKNMALYYTYLGSKMTEYYFEYIMESYDYITAVPIHKKKLKVRGYNQAELLAEYISEQINIPYCTVLKRTVNTKPQNALNKKERVTNIKNAFSLIDNIDIKNKSILIVDDIFTTGTTINECCKVLKKPVHSKLIFYLFPPKEKLNKKQKRLF